MVKNPPLTVRAPYQEKPLPHGTLATKRKDAVTLSGDAEGPTGKSAIKHNRKSIDNC